MCKMSENIEMILGEATMKKIHRLEKALEKIKNREYALQEELVKLYKQMPRAGTLKLSQKFLAYDSESCEFFVANTCGQTKDGTVDAVYLRCDGLPQMVGRHKRFNKADMVRPVI